MVTTLMQIIHCVVVNPSGLCCKTPAKKQHVKTNQVREINHWRKLGDRFEEI